MGPREDSAVNPSLFRPECRAPPLGNPRVSRCCSGRNYPETHAGMAALVVRSVRDLLKHADFAKVPRRHRYKKKWVRSRRGNSESGLWLQLLRKLLGPFPSRSTHFRRSHSCGTPLASSPRPVADVTRLLSFTPVSSSPPSSLLFRHRSWSLPLVTSTVSRLRLSKLRHHLRPHSYSFVTASSSQLLVTFP